MTSIEERVVEIEKRNKKVEIDKAWEISKTRTAIISILTFIIIYIYLTYADAKKPYMGALIPAIGFAISTISLKFIKQIWINHILEIKERR